MVFNFHDQITITKNTSVTFWAISNISYTNYSILIFIIHFFLSIETKPRTDRCFHITSIEFTYIPIYYILKNSNTLCNGKKWMYFKTIDSCINEKATLAHISNQQFSDSVQNNSDINIFSQHFARNRHEYKKETLFTHIRNILLSKTWGALIWYDTRSDAHISQTGYVILCFTFPFIRL